MQIQHFASYKLYICSMITDDKQNPFPVSGYYGPAMFCNRKNETRLLISNALNGVNTTLLSERRMGKTGLIHHVFHSMAKKKAKGIYIDIYATQ